MTEVLVLVGAILIAVVMLAMTSRGRIYKEGIYTRWVTKGRPDHECRYSSGEDYPEHCTICGGRVPDWPPYGNH